MDITGYSERGMMNALFYEMAFSDRPMELMNRFLALVHFGAAESIGAGWTTARVLIEQSLSDFGDADAVVLLESPDSRAAVFFEAKVKRSQKKGWTLQAEYDEFEQGQRTERELSSSNLFTQLYHKARFVEGLRSVGIEQLQAGLNFPRCSSKLLRKIGDNAVVLKAARLIKPFCEQVSYAAIVPDNATNLDSFLKRFPDARMPDGFGEWDRSRCGGVTWAKVAEFCAATGMTHTLSVFEFNFSQIY